MDPSTTCVARREAGKALTIGAFSICYVPDALEPRYGWYLWGLDPTRVQADADEIASGQRAKLAAKRTTANRRRKIDKRDRKRQ